MSDEEKPDTQKPLRPRSRGQDRNEKDEKEKKDRRTVNIQFARSLTPDQLNTILQLELIRARSTDPPKTEVSLPTELVHDIKFRLRYYSTLFGEVDRKQFFGNKDDGDGKDG